MMRRDCISPLTWRLQKAIILLLASFCASWAWSCSRSTPRVPAPNASAPYPSASAPVILTSPPVEERVVPEEVTASADEEAEALAREMAEHLDDRGDEVAEKHEHIESWRTPARWLLKCGHNFKRIQRDRRANDQEKGCESKDLMAKMVEFFEVEGSLDKARSCFYQRTMALALESELSEQGLDAQARASHPEAVFVAKELARCQEHLAKVHDRVRREKMKYAEVCGQEPEAISEAFFAHQELYTIEFFAKAPEERVPDEWAASQLEEQKCDGSESSSNFFDESWGFFLPQYVSSPAYLGATITFYSEADHEHNFGCAEEGCEGDCGEIYYHYDREYSFMGRVQEEMCACPFVYTKNKRGQWRYRGEILRHLNRPELEGEQTLHVGDRSQCESEAFEVRLTEEKPEVTHLDAVSLRLGDRELLPQVCLPARENAATPRPSFCEGDERYHVLQRGDQLELSFALDERTREACRRGEVELVAEGYYVPQ